MVPDGDEVEASDWPAATLAELRLRIQALATADGPFVVACARTGASPVPVAGHRFPDRETAAVAAEYTVAYRERLREMDPRTPPYDPVVHEVPSGTWDRIDVPSASVDPGADGDARDRRSPRDRKS